MAPVWVQATADLGAAVLFRALLGLLPDTARVEGSLRFGREPMDMDGSLQVAASLIYQNPGASLNPVFTIGQQLRLVAETDDPAVLEELLEQVGLPDPHRRDRGAATDGGAVRQPRALLHPDPARFLADRIVNPDLRLPGPNVLMQPIDSLIQECYSP